MVELVLDPQDAKQGLRGEDTKRAWLHGRAPDRPEIRPVRALAPYLAGRSGNLLKSANVANDLELNDKLVKDYVEILDLLFIVRRVPAYRKNRANRLATRMPKVHYVDTGLACHLLGLHDEAQLLGSRHYGPLLGNLIYMECCKHAGWAQEDVETYFLRSS